MALKAEHERELEAWSGVLSELDRLESEGAKPLLHEDKAGIVRKIMEDFHGRYASAPETLPPQLPPSSGLPVDIKDRIAGLAAPQRRVFRELLAKASSADPVARGAAIAEIRGAETGEEPHSLLLELIWRDFGQTPELKATLETLSAQRLALTEEDGVALTMAGVSKLVEMREGLEEALSYRYGRLRELEAELAALPLFKKRSAGGNKAASPRTPDLFELLDDKMATEKKRPATKSAYETSLNRFKKFAKHSRPEEVTKAQVIGWRDAMRAEGLDSATINKKHLAGLKSVLEWAVNEGHLRENVAQGVLDRTAKDEDHSGKGHSREDVERILVATFKGTKREGLSLPYKRGLFWLPWLLAYTGLRPVEAAQLRAEDIREHDGTPYILVTPEAGTTKGGNAWITGIHQHLIDLGFLDMVRHVGSGPLFYNAYPAGTNLAALKSPRSIEAYSMVSDWLRDELQIPAFRGRRNHAFRHAMTTASRGGGKGEDAWERLDKEARDYMLGSRPKNDAREGYGEWPPEAVDREINKLPRFNVVDTGWRPY